MKNKRGRKIELKISLTSFSLGRNKIREKMPDIPTVQEQEIKTKRIYGKKGIQTLTFIKEKIRKLKLIFEGVSHGSPMNCKEFPEL